MEVDLGLDDGGDDGTDEVTTVSSIRNYEDEDKNFGGKSCADDYSEAFPENLKDVLDASKSEDLQIATNDGCNIIKPIDKNVVHRICSGQVVVTLATAVKELVENSIDAGATNIDIRLVEYGSKSIEVTDNGCGVEEANFEGLGLKHHTSKIRDFEDLTSIETFGFRGEALSSLCALSNLTVITKSSHSVDGKGYRIEYDFKGRIAKRIPCARDVGTTVVIKNLFSTLPVRHVEFLKNLKREFTRMVAVLYGYCLITAGVRMNCTNLLESGTVSKVLSIPGSVSVREKIVCLFGSKQLESLAEIKAEENITIDENVLEEFGLKDLCGGNPYRFQGFISLPYKGRGASDRQFFFFNSRPCDPAKLSRVVNEVYHGYSKNQYPFIFLDIRTAQENLDVNVTPDKRQIYARNEKILCAAVKVTVMSVLTKAASSFGAGNSTSSKFSSGFVDPLLPDDDDDDRSNITAYEENSINEGDSVLQEGQCRSIFMSSERIPRAEGSMSMHREPGNNMRSFLKDFSYKSKPAFGRTTSDQNQGREQDDRIQSRSPSRKRISLNRGGKSLLDFFKSKEKRRRIENYSDEEDVIVLNDEYEKTQDTENDNMTSKTHDSIEIESPPSENDVRTAQVSKYYSPTKKSSFNDERSMSKKESANEDEGVIVVYDDEFAEEGSSRVISLGRSQVNLQDCSVKLYGNAGVVDCAINFSDIRRRNLNTGKSINTDEPQNEGRRFRATISTEENQRAEEELRKQIKKEMFPEMEIIGQFNLGFIIVKHGPDIFIVDQHATDEKYNFEDLEKNTVLQTQKLICPVELQLPTVSQGIVLDNLEVFRKNGFGFFVQDDDSSIGRIQLTQIPYSKSYEFGKQDIDELIFLLEDAPEKAFYRPSRVRDMLASRACRKSVMIGTHLNGKEMRRIVDHMAVMDQPWNCPHGRPTIRHLLNLNMIFVHDVYAFPH